MFIYVRILQYVKRF